MKKHPLVGLLYNSTVPHVIEEAPELVEYLAVLPERLWYDFGDGHASGSRFHRARGAIEILRGCAQGRVIAGHGIGLSLASAMPIDRPLLRQIASIARDLGFRWYSEHLSMFLTPHGSIPNAQAGLGLPVVYDGEMFALLRTKLRELDAALACPLMLETPSIFTPIPEQELSEPAFLNRLQAEAGCGTVLDLHNLYVNARNGGRDPRDYIEELDPRAVREIHMAGGDVVAGFYTDSHSRLSSPEVWSLAHEFIPRFEYLRAITFEFHESYFDRLGARGIADELERIHELAARVTLRGEVEHAR